MRRRIRPGAERGVPRSTSLHRAFDELRFGPDRTLNLRADLPRPVEAERRAEGWLREKQVARAGEVLVITGRGNQSWEGVSVVRECIVRLLNVLRRRGVVAAVVEHTPGSFVVTLAPLRALREAPRRTRPAPEAPRTDPAALAGLAATTRERLRALASLALQDLGVRDEDAFIDKEMLKQFDLLSRGVPPGPERELRLRAAIQRAIDEFDPA